MYSFRYACSTVGVCISICMHVNIHVYQVYSHVTVHIFHMSLNKYGDHNANIMVNGNRDPTFLHMYDKTKATKISTSFLLTCMGQQQICLSNARSTGIRTFHIIGICPLHKYACHITHVCPNACILHSTHRLHV